MKIFKLLLLLCIALVVDLTISGCCECVEPLYYDYTNCSIEVALLDNSEERAKVTEQSELDKDAFGLRLKISRSENTCMRKAPFSIFSQTAYGFSCDCPPEIQYSPLDSILNIKIVSLNDWDSEHPAGSDVSDAFFVNKRTEFIALPEYDEYLDEDPEYADFPETYFDFFLMAPPSQEATHQFQVTVEISDGRTIQNISNTIKLK